MSYFGKAFVFDSVPCETYDLMMYDVGNDDSDVSIPSIGGIQDETVGDKWKPYFYGITPAGKLEFDITFGVNEWRIDHDKFFDRFEIAEITSWLTGYSEYKWLYIEQPDMLLLGFRCMITDLKLVPYGKTPWAFKAHVICDSPYAYLEAEEFSLTVNGSATMVIRNPSSSNEFYLPEITFERTSGTALSIRNAQDQDRGPAFSDIPGSVGTIWIDNEHCVITNDQNVNLYSGFNFQFLRLVRGENNITITGNGTVRIRCEFPVNVGG